MSDSSLSDTLRKLAARLDGVRDVLGGGPPAAPQYYANPPWPPLNTTVPVAPHLGGKIVFDRLDTLTRQVEELQRSVSALRSAQSPYAPAPILPLNPMHGIEVVPKREVVLPEAASLSVADRLLLNRDAKKALEAEEMGASRDDEYPLGEEDEEEQTDYEPPRRTGQSVMMEIEAEAEEAEEAEAEEAEEAEAEEAEAEEAEAEAEEAEEAEEADGPEEDTEELVEFEYKGNTFYRDSENNVFMTDEDGDLVEDPIGTWNPERNRISMNPRE